MPRRGVATSVDLNEHDSWMLSAKIDGYWQHCYYDTQNEAIDVFRSLYSDYGDRLEDLEIVDPHGIFATRGIVEALRMSWKLGVH